MAVQFKGRWRARVFKKNSGFAQRIRVTGAAAGNGVYPGVVGQSLEFDGADTAVSLQWNNGAGSGWRDSAVLESVGMSSSIVILHFLRADDNFPAERDGDFDDLAVSFEYLDPLVEIVQRPFALDRGTLTMLPDGIFDASQGVQYMGVRIRNAWVFDWTADVLDTAMKIGIAPDSRVMLASQGIKVIDAWSPAEQQALGQVMDGGSVGVDELPIGAERMIYFKLDLANAQPGKPEIGLVAQRVSSFDPNFAAPWRIARRRIFVTRLSYDPVAREMVARLPEGTLRLRLKEVVIDRKAANAAASAARECLGRRPGSCGPAGSESGRLADELRRLLRGLLAGEDVDPCRLRTILDECGRPECCESGGPGDGGQGGHPGGGLADGNGADDWCRFKPVAWLPVEFEYRVEYATPFAGQLGPLAFEDPWWKIALILLAVALGLGSEIADYVQAAKDPKFIIGRVVRRGRTSKNVDCALSDLDGSRSIDLGMLDAQSDDVNNAHPIVAIDSIVQLDRSDNFDPNGEPMFGMEDASEEDIVWKSGGTSGTTRGRVADVHYKAPIEFDEEEYMSGSVIFTKQVLVKQIKEMPQPLSQGGDSGAVWVNLTNGRPVALNFSGDEADVGTFGGANPIRAVADELNIRFNP
ncbi:MAG: hypothetical protein QOD42_1402 [Sphingomonadales bacterium]|jgi:hypothetical protein|nr:hypothetical protein [Sphingomonadales bacterium]